MIYLVSIVVVLGVLIFVHELGHFLAAKIFGVRVERFSIGFPPRLFGKTIGETDYCIGGMPFGGFVRLIGEDPTDARRDEKNSYYVKTLKQRALVVVAGVFMNLMLAVLIFYFVEDLKFRDIK